MRYGILGSSAAILLIRMCGASSANPACTALVAAITRISEQPGVYQQTMEGTPSVLLIESISLPDAMYLREGGSGPWRRVPIDQAAIRAMAQKGFEVAPLSDCTGPATGLDGAMPIQIYQYRQPDLMKSGAFTTSALWIGGDDLPRRLVMSPTSYQTMEYGTFSAPTDFVPAREQRGRPAR